MICVREKKSKVNNVITESVFNKKSISVVVKARRVIQKHSKVLNFTSVVRDLGIAGRNWKGRNRTDNILEDNLKTFFTWRFHMEMSSLSWIGKSFKYLYVCVPKNSLHLDDMTGTAFHRIHWTHKGGMSLNSK